MSIDDRMEVIRKLAKVKAIGCDELSDQTIRDVANINRIVADERPELPKTSRRPALSQDMAILIIKTLNVDSNFLEKSGRITTVRNLA